MNRFRFTALVGVPAAAVLLALAGCGGGPAAATGGSGAAKAQAVTIHYKVVPSDDPLAKTGPDGNKHDTFWALDPTTVKVGDQVTVVVDNYDDMAHGMTFPELGLTKLIAAGKDGQATETTYSFTATKAGKYRWYCPVPCDTDSGQWAMKTSSSGPDQDGFMAGYITVQ